MPSIFPVLSHQGPIQPHRSYGLGMLPVYLTFNPLPNKPLCLPYKSSENTVGKGEIDCNEQFLPSPQCFLPFSGDLSAVFIKFKIVICKLFQFGRTLNLMFGKRLTV